jgi:hypothetical protein
MTLINKILKAHSNKPSDYSRLYTPTAEIIEQIADDYAINFAEWINRVSYRSSDNSWWLTQNSGDIKKTTEELLEIFKNEKGL